RWNTPRSRASRMTTRTRNPTQNRVIRELRAPGRGAYEGDRVPRLRQVRPSAVARRNTWPPRGRRPVTGSDLGKNGGSFERARERILRTSQRRLRQVRPSAVAGRNTWPARGRRPVTGSDPGKNGGSFRTGQRILSNGPEGSF